MAAPSRPSTWAAMQRRIARRAGQVSSFQERPRLLAAAEDPEVWEEVLQSWPDVAQKLRPASRCEVECSDVPSLEELLPWIREALGSNFVAENFHQLMPVAKVKQVPRDVRPIGTKTPPRLQLTGPKSLRQNLDKLMASLQGGQDHRNGDLAGIDRQPRTLARQHYDLNGDPTVAADEFTLATRKAERRLHGRKLAQSERAGGYLAELQSPRRKHYLREASEAEEVRSHLLERLDYLHTCRGSMGESLYARQRQRLEMQAHLRTAQKYSLQEKPPEARCAYSAQVRGGTTKAWDPELLEALRPQTAPELQGVPSRPFTPRSQMTKPPSPPKRETHDVEAVARTFNFARQCAAKKLPMPNLGTFTLGDESRLKLSNWSLGDDPLMALASSPLRDNVAVVEEGNFAGNRLINKGVDAIVSSLGSDLTTLNLSANSFDGHGLESVLSFIRRAPKLTDINLSGNKLSDSSVSRLCLQLSQHCQHLRRLSLSDVMIGWDGETAGASLGSLVTVLKMKNLDVSFNALHGQGAVEFLKSLPSSRLSCLDMSWNCLGKGAQSRSVAEEMSQVFQRCGSLQHLDVSYNSFQSQELEILAKGLAANRTLWGLHIDGSGAVVDADAFLIPPAEFKPESNDPRAQSGRRKKSKSKTARKQSKAPKKEAEAEISVAGTLLSPQELEVRMQALQGQMELQDLIQEYHQRVDQEEKDQMETARRQTTNLALMDAAEIERMPVSMPELIRRLKPCQKMSPRSQDEMLQSLTSEVRPELPALLRQQGDRPSLLYFQGTKENFLYKHSNCWICGDWVEVLLEAGPQDLPWPSDGKCREKGMAVCALVSIDNFSRPIALHANWDGIWRGSRFLPPTERCFVVFQMGEELITVHQGLPVRSLQRPMAMPLWRQSPQVGAAVGSCTEVNVLRIGALAEAFCNGTEPACRGARVKCTAAQASFAQRGKVSEAHPRCPVAWTKAANI